MRKIINDPVHGFITINDELVGKIISHPYYQRLRRIKQMALAYLVYPGAVHTRFHHSLGAYHLMCCALDELKLKGIYISPSEEQAAKVAILLHDIGHGPFSHALEHTLVDVHHEDLSMLIMEKMNIAFDGALDEAIQVFKNQHPKPFLHQLVSSQLDVDRLDYLARDSFFTGVSEGVIGYDRIIKMLQVHDHELVVEEKGIHSIEKYIIARRLMYWQVYLHKTVLSSELMLVNILKRAKEIHTDSNPLFATPSLLFFLNKKYTLDDFKNKADCLTHFCNLDDNDISTSIKVWATHDDNILSDLCTRLLNRNLFKVIYYNDKTPIDIDKLQQEIINKLNLPLEALPYYFIKGSTSNMAYSEDNDEIKIINKQGFVQKISEVEDSLIGATVSEHVKKQYICYSKV